MKIDIAIIIPVHNRIETSKIGLKAIEEDAYLKTLEQLAAKKWNSLKGERGLSRMAKTYAFLHQRGFEPLLYQPIVQKLYKP